MAEEVLPGGFALPVMRGFPCPVTTPMMGANAGPPEGIGCGWANVNGMGAQFFITIHAEGGFVMSAELDYARYRRFAENYAAMGKQALISGNLDEASENDPLEALKIAREAMIQASAAFRARDMHNQANKLVEAITAADRAMMIE